MKNNKQLAIDAVALVTPAIEQLFNQTNRKELHIVIMNPAVKPWESSFEDAVLYEASLGKPHEWTIPFDQLARKKAQQAWRDGSANINHQNLHPSSLRDGDVLFYGSFVYGNIVVACSGVQQWFDMLVSGWIAVAIEQLTIHEYQTQKIENPTQTYRD
ncbi:hypothetical protein GCM10007916_15680 [Psychromonas marina]|uniref:Uncharacterized protein n=1 Tax=Psychromonas marina TaxID=88364 RepID=A0ABQ6DZB2_9GAMM|nr:hypothetical protein [Psychromonas marina]GLS90501.1 hypothetical protein GCM10007916_15680 [Psychromonas marina]